MIPDEVVVGIGNPEAGRRLVGIQEREGAVGDEPHILSVCVTRLDPILDKVLVAHHVVGDVALHVQIVTGVGCQGAVEALVDGAPLNGGVALVRAPERIWLPNRVDVEGVAPEAVGLARERRLDVLQVHLASQCHDVGPKARVICCAVDEDAPGEMEHLCPRLHCLATGRVCLADVFVFQGFIERDCRHTLRLRECRNFALLGLAFVIRPLQRARPLAGKACTGNDDLVSDLPIRRALDLNGGVANLGRGLQEAPGRRHLLTPQEKLPVRHGQGLNPKDRQGLRAPCAMEQELELVRMGGRLAAHEELAVLSVDDDGLRLELDVLAHVLWDLEHALHNPETDVDALVQQEGRVRGDVHDVRVLVRRRRKPPPRSRVAEAVLEVVTGCHGHELPSPAAMFPGLGPRLPVGGDLAGPNHLGAQSLHLIRTHHGGPRGGGFPPYLQRAALAHFVARAVFGFPAFHHGVGVFLLVVDRVQDIILAHAGRQQGSAT